jgi:uncharacterized protein YndB with AHSA1/START domain
MKIKGVDPRVCLTKEQSVQNQFRGAKDYYLMSVKPGTGAQNAVALVTRNQLVAYLAELGYYATWRLHNMNDRIEKSIEIKAPVSRVWRALTDHREFGEWFRVKLERPFVQGQPARGQITHPGYEHLAFEAVVKTMEPERFFSFTWHPYAVDPKKDYSKEPPTLVEFRLEKTANGTRLSVTESGFEKIPTERRLEAFRMNEGGWAEQVKNIERHVTAKP